jgi:predicted RecB family nuclease
VCLTAKVALDVDPYERETSITGLETYADRLPAAWLTPRTTHCSTALRAGYRATAMVDGAEITLVGIGTTEASLGAGSRGDTGRGTLVELFPNGCSNCEDVDPAAFGLRGIRGVGEKRSRALREAGFSTPADVADAEPYELNDLSGFGGATTRRVRATAEARATGTVVATGDDPLPRGEPVFIDIETDGLEPSTAWLVGVLDGGPEDGHYMPFTERAPGDGSHLEAFLVWAEANAANRPLVAWNGYSFDFPVIRDLVRKHCPERLPMWDDAYQFDPLWWARDKNGGNAALPGRSNKLEAVAEALGWEPQTTGIDGSVVAKRYSAYRREWLADGADGPVDEPDWDRFEAYCEDDVRALATIYEALTDASRREPGTDTRSGTETSTQGALSDFS